MSKLRAEIGDVSDDGMIEYLMTRDLLRVLGGGSVGCAFHRENDALYRYQLVIVGQHRLPMKHKRDLRLQAKKNPPTFFSPTFD